MSGTSTENDGQGMIVNPKPTADNQDWDGDDADRADRLRFEEEQAMIREQSEARAAKAAAEAKKAAEAQKAAAPAKKDATRLVSLGAVLDPDQQRARGHLDGDLRGLAGRIAVDLGGHRFRRTGW